MKKLLSLICAVVLLASCAKGTAESLPSSQPAAVSQPKMPSSSKSAPAQALSQAPAQQEEHKAIMLYGEAHGNKDILNKEFEIWKNYYDNDGRRHLFIEWPYYTAQFLNLWMQADSNAILTEIFADLKGTAGGTDVTKKFYEKIKEQCPETIFHGTDVGHQHQTTGQRYKKYLEDNGLTDSEQYEIAQQVREQGRKFYATDDGAYRENKMAENFIREYEKIKGEKIMGIYGGAHTAFDTLDFSTQSVPSMAAQLKEKYGEEIGSVNLSHSGNLAKVTQPILTQQITVQGKAYTASLFGRQENVNQSIKSVKYWRLENAYEDFKNTPLTEEYLPCAQYPVKITENEIYFLEYITVLGESKATLYRFDNKSYNGTKVLYALNTDT